MSDTNHFGDFNFSFALAQKAKSDLQDQHEKLLERISNIVESEKFHVNGFPVLKNIIGLQPKKVDLMRLSKALERLADLVEMFSEIDKKVNLIDVVESNPNWFAVTFGDFSKEIDQDIEKLFNIND
jgi:Trm5-related predicted tRNA methylase